MKINEKTFLKFYEENLWQILRIFLWLISENLPSLLRLKRSLLTARWEIMWVLFRSVIHWIIEGQLKKREWINNKDYNGYDDN